MNIDGVFRAVWCVARRGTEGGRVRNFRSWMCNTCRGFLSETRDADGSDPGACGVCGRPVRGTGKRLWPSVCAAEWPSVCAERASTTTTLTRAWGPSVRVALGRTRPTTKAKIIASRTVRLASKRAVTKMASGSPEDSWFRALSGGRRGGRSGSGGNLHVASPRGPACPTRVETHRIPRCPSYGLVPAV